VIGVEPAIANDAQRSWQTGRDCAVNGRSPHPGRRTAHPLRGERNLPILRQYVADILTVTEAEIVAALQFLWTRLKLVVEPSSAVALAPLLTGQIGHKGQRVGVILSGGNVDVAHLGALFTD
jgi:threonine dehydratase